MFCQNFWDAQNLQSETNTTQCFLNYKEYNASLWPSKTIRVSYSFGFCQSYSCCKSVCYTHCFIFSRPWNLVYQTQQVSKNVTISHFHHCPPFNLLSVICMATAHSVLLFPLIFFPHCRRGVAGVSAISDPHWKWQVNFAQLLPFSVPLSSDAPVSSHSVAAWL